MLRDSAMEREWSEGVSVFVSRETACAKALRFRLKIGTHVVALEVPDDGTIEFAQTGVDPDHWTLYAPADVLMGLVSGNPIDVREEPRERSSI